MLLDRFDEEIAPFGAGIARCVLCCENRFGLRAGHAAIGPTGVAHGEDFLTRNAAVLGSLAGDIGEMHAHRSRNSLRSYAAMVEQP